MIVLDQIRSGACGPFAALPTQELVRVLYCNDAPAPGRPILLALHELANALPREQLEICKTCDTLSDTNAALLALRAGLLAARDGCAWLHFRIARLLQSLGELQITDVATPKLIHALLALDQIAKAPDALPFLAELASNLLIDFSHADALGFALRAVEGGSANAINTMEHLARREAAAPTLDGLDLVDRYRTRNGTPTFPRTAAPEPIHSRAGSTASFERPRHGAEHFIFRCGMETRVRPPITVYAIDNAVLSIRNESNAHTEFYVFSASHELYGELSRGLRPFTAPLSAHYKSAGLISDHFSQKLNVCHFLLDCMTRVEIYKECGCEPEFFLCALKSEYIDSVAAVSNLGTRLVQNGAREFSITCDRLLISSNLLMDWRHPAHFCEPALLAPITRWNTKVQPVDQRGAAARGRYFISRADASVRRIVNQAEVDEVLRDFAIEQIVLGTISLTEQIALFKSASLVVGVHGAGLTNIVFGAGPLAVIEILPPMVATDAYWQLSRALGCAYDAIIGYDPQFGRPDYSSWGHKPELNDRDMIVDCSELRAALDAITA